MKLYEINEAILELLENGYNEEVIEACVDDNGEFHEELVGDKVKELLDRYEGERNDKIEGVCLYIKSLEAEADAIKKEENLLKQRREKKEKKAEWLKEYIAFALAGNKFETSKCAVTFRKTEKVIIDNLELIPRQYCKVKTTVDADKNALKKDIKAGIEFSGCHIEIGNSMTIK